MSGATLDVFGYRITLSTKLGVSQRYKKEPNCLEKFPEKMLLVPSDAAVQYESYKSYPCKWIQGARHVERPP